MITPDEVRGLVDHEVLQFLTEPRISEHYVDLDDLSLRITDAESRFKPVVPANTHFFGPEALEGGFWNFRGRGTANISAGWYDASGISWIRSYRTPLGNIGHSPDERRGRAPLQLEQATRSCGISPDCRREVTAGSVDCGTILAGPPDGPPNPGPRSAAWMPIVHW